MQPIPVESEQAVAVPVGEGEFTLALPVFEGPLQLLLHLIESRQLDILTVPLAEVADAYVEHLTSNAVDAANLSEFVSIAAQLIFLKSKRMLPSEPLPPMPEGADEPDEEELRRRLIEYRALRDAAAARRADGIAPVMRREPRGDRPARGARRADSVTVLVDGARDPRRDPRAGGPAAGGRPARDHDRPADRRPAPCTSRAAAASCSRPILARCQSRTETAVTFLATLELVRRRQVTGGAARHVRPDRDRDRARGDAVTARGPDDLSAFFEALLFIAERPLTTAELAELGGVPRLQAEDELSALAERLDEDGRGIRVQRHDDAWQLVTAPEVGSAPRGLCRPRGGAALPGGPRGAGGGRVPPALHARRRRARPGRRFGLRDPLADASAAGRRGRSPRHAGPAGPVRDDVRLSRALRADIDRRPAAALERCGAAHRADRDGPGAADGA